VRPIYRAVCTRHSADVFYCKSFTSLFVQFTQPGLIGNFDSDEEYASNAVETEYCKDSHQKERVINPAKDTPGGAQCDGKPDSKPVQFQVINTLSGIVPIAMSQGFQTPRLRAAFE
jgi:hypothetical protein